MPSDKKPWTWGEDARRKLNMILHIAEKADKAVRNHLEAMIHRLLQQRFKFERDKLFGVTSGIIDIGFIVTLLLKPENRYASNIAGSIVNDYKNSTRQLTNVEAKITEMQKSISSMTIPELYRQVEDLIDNKPLSEIGVRKRRMPRYRAIPKYEEVKRGRYVELDKRDSD
jgi:hypothetical protein